MLCSIQQRWNRSRSTNAHFDLYPLQLPCFILLFWWVLLSNTTHFSLFHFRAQNQSHPQGLSWHRIATLHCLLIPFGNSLQAGCPATCFWSNRGCWQGINQQNQVNKWHRDLPSALVGQSYVSFLKVIFCFFVFFLSPVNKVWANTSTRPKWHTIYVFLLSSSAGWPSRLKAGCMLKLVSG